MAILNHKVETLKTHEGATAKHISPELQLRRSVMNCLLFEKGFYESGVEIAERIKQLIPQVDAKKCYEIACSAREDAGLRHVPLLILREMCRLRTHRRYVSRGLQRVIKRPDQMTDFLALYWDTNEGKRTLPHKVKDGLARVFTKFNEYQLRKHAHSDRKVKLRDVLFLSHAKPIDEKQATVWKRLVDNELKPIDTWETMLSAGQDKKETFHKLMIEEKLGALAYVRNLRNMVDAGCSVGIMIDYADRVDVSKVFPWQFIAAATYAPSREVSLEKMFRRAIANQPKLPGKTVFLIDHSGSMSDLLSAKGTMKYTDAACGVAMMLRELCDNVEIFTFSESVVYIPPRSGFALRDAIKISQPMGGTLMGQAITEVLAAHPDYDRLIVITDEQSSDRVPNPTYGRKNYMINVASNKNGVGYGPWTHLDGFSSHVLTWMHEQEKIEQTL